MKTVPIWCGFFYDNAKEVFLLIRINNTNDAMPKIEKPINKGSAVVSTKLPITVAIGTAINVETKPVIAAPIPAI